MWNARSFPPHYVARWPRQIVKKWIIKQQYKNEIYQRVREYSQTRMRNELKLLQFFRHSWTYSKEELHTKRIWWEYNKNTFKSKDKIFSGESKRTAW
jgi:hypothetical protein